MSRGNIAIWFDPATQWYAPSKGKPQEISLNSNSSFDFGLSSPINLTLPLPTP